jgi:hypothetical protein
MKPASSPREARVRARIPRRRLAVRFAEPGRRPSPRRAAASALGRPRPRRGSPRGASSYAAGVGVASRGRRRRPPWRGSSPGPMSLPGRAGRARLPDGPSATRSPCSPSNTSVLSSASPGAEMERAVYAPRAPTASSCLVGRALLSHAARGRRERQRHRRIVTSSLRDVHGHRDESDVRGRLHPGRGGPGVEVEASDWRHPRAPVSRTALALVLRA